MKTNKQNADFLHIGKKLIKWYDTNARQLPWRENQHPYNIWISEIVLQQTQVKQGLAHYLRFIERFPTTKELHKASEDDVLLYWKGLGYYSRAINLHKAAHQIIEEFDGEFPTHYQDILKLKGVGKYTAAAVASICFDENFLFLLPHKLFLHEEGFHFLIHLGQYLKAPSFQIYPDSGYSIN